MAERLLTLPAVAAQLECSVTTVKRRVASGALPVFRDGHLVRVRDVDLRRYIVERVSRRAAHNAGNAKTPAGAKVMSGRLWAQE